MKHTFFKKYNKLYFGLGLMWLLLGLLRLFIEGGTVWFSWLFLILGLIYVTTNNPFVPNKILSFRNDTFYIFGENNFIYKKIKLQDVAETEINSINFKILRINTSDIIIQRDQFLKNDLHRLEELVMYINSRIQV